MRFVAFFLAICLFLAFVQAQRDWDDDDDPRWPGDDDNGDCDWDEDEDECYTTTTRRGPTSTRRPTPTSTRRPTPTSTRRPTSTRSVPTPTPTRPTDDPEDPEEEPEPPIPTTVDTFSNVTVYQPDDLGHFLTSPRTEDLPNKTTLAVWNDPSQANNALVVYRSRDDGFSWYAWGNATSAQAGRKLLQPHLLYVPGPWSSETNVTLLAVNAVDAKSTNIELYASWDDGETFELVTRVAEGGPMQSNVTTAKGAVGEPFMLMHEGRLSLYYSDSRDGQHAQKIVHQSTADMWENWGGAIDVAASNELNDREGMLTAVELPNKQYILVFESTQNSGNETDRPVYFKLTTTPENVGTEPMQEIITSTGVKPFGASYVTWSSAGGVNGTIVLSDSVSKSIFINQALGHGVWEEMSTAAGRAWAREVRAVSRDKTKLRFAGGADEKGETSDILVTVFDLGKALTAS